MKASKDYKSEMKVMLMVKYTDPCYFEHANCGNGGLFYYIVEHDGSSLCLFVLIILYSLYLESDSTRFPSPSTLTPHGSSLLPALDFSTRRRQ